MTCNNAKKIGKPGNTPTRIAVNTASSGITIKKETHLKDSLKMELYSIVDLLPMSDRQCDFKCTP